MWAGLVYLCLCILPRLGRGFSWENVTSPSSLPPEPRSFATLSGSVNGSAIFLHGGFSHARSAWLNETWKLELNGGVAKWTQISSDPMFQHATLATLGDEVLLIGGMDSDGNLSDQLYYLSNSGTWTAAQVEGTVPQLYRHSAVSYTVAGQPHVLLCGGVDTATNATVGAVYDLSYNASCNCYTFTEMSPLPQPLFGHSLAAGENDSVVYVSGGLSDSFPALPRAALPPQLAAIMSGNGLTSTANASASECVYKFTWTNSSASGSGSLGGNWSKVGAAARRTAFHASWVSGGVLFMQGGVAGNTVGTPEGAPYGLQAVRFSEDGAAAEYNLSDTQAALGRWGDVQPGGLSGAATWVATYGNESGPSQPRVWLFGGWWTPQPLPASADSYLCPQDSSLTWRLGQQGSTGLAMWMSPLQGGMAPRSAAGLMAVPVSVAGARKLLLVGGRAPNGWTGAIPSSPKLTYDSGLLSSLPLPPGNSLLDSATSYQLYDMWLLDLATGARELVWASTGSCPSSPSTRAFGSPDCPAAVGRLWDRRLVEVHERGLEAGAGGTALYLQAEEVVPDLGSASLQGGIWNVTLSTQTLTAADGTFTAVVAAWTSLLPTNTIPDTTNTTNTNTTNTTNTNTSSSSSSSLPCYPRFLYGAAHLAVASNASAAAASDSHSYLALHGGLSGGLNPSSLVDGVTDSLCLLELSGNGTRWVQPFNSRGVVPPARYRHACAARTGLSSYSMTCYGGVSGESPSPKLLSDAWTLTSPSGVTILPGNNPQVYWSVAYGNDSSARAGRRADHWLLSVRGGILSSSPSSSPSSSTAVSSTLLANEVEFSPVLLLGGALDPTAAPPRLPQQPMWLMDASSCADPDAIPSALASFNTSSDSRKSQIWLSVIPDGGALPAVAAEAAAARDAGAAPLAAWALAGAALSRNESVSELWLLLAEGAEGAVGRVVPIKATALSGGCLSTAVRPSCGNLSYSYDSAVKACMPGGVVSNRVVNLTTTADRQTLDLFGATGGFVVLDTDGAGVPTWGPKPSGSICPLGNVVMPPGLVMENLTVVAYGRPYIELGRTNSSLGWGLTLPKAYSLKVKVYNNNGTALANATTELRIQVPSGLYRRRRPDASSGPSFWDARCTNATGDAEFVVFNASAASQTITTRYAVVITPPGSKTNYSAVLLSPVEAARSTGRWVGDDNTTTSLLQGDQVVYNISLPPGQQPSSDGLVPVALTVTFKTPNTTVRLPQNRRWLGELLWGGNLTGRTSAVPPTPISNTYAAAAPLKLRLNPGTYTFGKIADENMSYVQLCQSPFSVTVPASPGGQTQPLPLSLELGSLFMPLSMPLALGGMSSSAAAAHFWMRMSSLSSAGPDGAAAFIGGGPGRGQVVVEDPWIVDQLVDDTPIAVLPGVAYRVMFYLTSYAFNSAPIDVLVPDGSCGVIPYVQRPVPLPLTLLCDPSQPVLWPMMGKSGKLNPNSTVRTVVLSGNCTFQLAFAPGVTDLLLNYSMLPSGLTIYVRTDSVYDSLAGPGTYRHWTVKSTNAAVSVVAANDSVVDFLVISWDTQTNSNSLLPQFIMMIAASSAAAGAMLLFLCLWHCVFRPVQLRRQQAAQAMAAAANAAAATPGGAPGARGASRHRIPRRYLRMMITTTYSAKDAAVARTSSGLDPYAKLRTEETADVAGADADADATAAAAPPAVGGEAVAAAGQPAAAPPPPPRTAARVQRPTSPAMAVAVAATAAAQPTAPAAAAQPKSEPSTAGGDGATIATSLAPGGPSSLAPPSSGPASHSDPEVPGGEVCAICLCDFEDGERIKHLPCRHFYHVPCIDQWLGRDITCPLCKDNVLEALKALFGPLPARGARPPAAAAAAGGGAAELDGTATAAAAVGSTDPASAPPGAVPENEASAAATAGGGGGVAASTPQVGMDLEMVVIEPAAEGSNRTASQHGVGVGSQRVSAVSSVRITESTSRSAVHGAAAAVAAVGSHSGGGQPPPPPPSALPLVLSGGGGSGISASHSRELRPMRRNISADLATDGDGTSTDSDSGDDSEYDTASGVVRRHGSSAGGAAAAAGRAFQAVPPPPPQGAVPLRAAAASGRLGAPDSGGNQLAVVLPPLPTAAAAALAGGYYETGGLSPSPRPVAEQVQRSPFSSSSNGIGIRWVSGSSQVAPLPRASASLAGGPTLHRLARAQEAQMAVAAAALSAAAAGVSAGGVSSGAGGGGGSSAVGMVGGGNSWCTTSSASLAAGPPPPPMPPLFLDGGGAAAAAAAMLSYRVHTNPLALGNSSCRSDIGSPRVHDAAAAALLAAAAAAVAAEQSQGSISGGAAAAAVAAAAPPDGPTPSSAAGPHPVSVLMGSHVSVGGGGGGSGRSRPSSASSTGGNQQPRAAVPAVSASCEDVIRLAATAAAAQPQGRATVTGVSSWGPGGGAGGGGSSKRW